MDEHLKRKRLEIGDDDCPRGCIGGLFQFLDFNQRLHVRKLLVYHKRSGNGRHHGRSRSPKVKQNVTVDEENLPVEDRSITVEQDKRKISRSDSNKVLKRSINSNRRHSVHDFTHATTPQNMHLLRCTLPKIRLLNSDVIPVMDLRVAPTSKNCTVEMLSCEQCGTSVYNIVLASKREEKKL